MSEYSPLPPSLPPPPQYLEVFPLSPDVKRSHTSGESSQELSHCVT